MLETINDRDFTRYQGLLQRVSGIRLGAEKKALLCGRLAKRVRQRGVGSYGEYFDLISGGGDPSELQTAVDLLTTNETYFFREPRHFDFLSRYLQQGSVPRTPRVWSAACSSGEEPYSVAMVLADRVGEASWEIVATDLSTRVLERARSGHYVLDRVRGMPHYYLSKYCLKGTGAQEGTFLIDRRLRSRVSFRHANLLDVPGDIGTFDIAFLRNVLIYFDVPTKRRVVENVAAHLKPGGYLLVGHSESLNGISTALVSVAPAIYRKP